MTTNMREKIQVKVTRDKAISMVKSSRNRKIYIHVAHQFQSKTEAGFGYNLSSALQVNAKQAEAWLQDAISDSMVEKVEVEIHMADYSMFIS